MDRVVWIWRYSNRTAVTRVSMRPARMQQGPSKKGPGGRERNKRDPYLKMCLPGDAGKGMAFMGQGNRNLRRPGFHLEGRQRRLRLARWV